MRAAKSKVLVLPGLDTSILETLPPLITVPTSGREDKHKPITHATLGEGRAYFRLLDEQLKNDGLRHRAMEFLLKPCEGLPDDLIIPDAWAAAMARDDT